MTQRRYGGPTVVYLGAGSVLTARHVGHGEIHLQKRIFPPDYTSRHTLLNKDGSGADAIVFRVAGEAELPALPLVALADRPPEIGEEILLIGFGRERDKVIEWDEEGRVRFGFEWTNSGRKRWGTNRVTANQEQIHSSGRATQIFSFDFDQPNSPRETPYEAQAAVGDSGGAVFVRRDGEWLLAGIMISVSTETSRPRNTTMYGDRTFAADLSYYREEIMRWARPACSNELDDDGDRKIDFPLDPGCHAPEGGNERDLPTLPTDTRTTWAVGISGLGLLSSAAFAIFTNRDRT